MKYNRKYVRSVKIFKANFYSKKKENKKCSITEKTEENQIKEEVTTPRKSSNFILYVPKYDEICSFNKIHAFIYTNTVSPIEIIYGPNKSSTAKEKENVKNTAPTKTTSYRLEPKIKTKRKKKQIAKTRYLGHLSNIRTRKDTVQLCQIYKHKHIRDAQIFVQAKTCIVVSKREKRRKEKRKNLYRVLIKKANKDGTQAGSILNDMINDLSINTHERSRPNRTSRYESVLKPKGKKRRTLGKHKIKTQYLKQLNKRKTKGEHNDTNMCNLKHIVPVSYTHLTLPTTPYV